MSPGGLLSMGTGDSTGAGLSLAHADDGEEAGPVGGLEAETPEVVLGDWRALGEELVHPAIRMPAARTRAKVARPAERLPLPPATRDIPTVESITEETSIPSIRSPDLTGIRRTAQSSQPPPVRFGGGHEGRPAP